MKHGQKVIAIISTRSRWVAAAKTVARLQYIRSWDWADGGVIEGAINRWVIKL